MYAPKMKGVCLRYVGDAETAKDVVQEGFIKVFSNIRQYSEKGSFDGWMKRIFVNTAISHLRKHNKKYNHISIEDVNEANFHYSDNHHYNESEGNDNKHVDLKHNNAEFVLSADLSESELLGALQRIPEHYRVVFNLSCIENMKHDEIAQLLDIDITTSRTRLLRARGLIQKELYSFCLEKLSQ